MVINGKSYTTTQLTINNDDDDWAPNEGFNNNGQVVWHGTGGTGGESDYEIFFYDGNSTIQLTTNNENDFNPNLNNNGQVVWYGSGGIDGGTDTEIFFATPSK